MPRHESYVAAEEAIAGMVATASIAASSCFLQTKWPPRASLVVRAGRPATLSASSSRIHAAVLPTKGDDAEGGTGLHSSVNHPPFFRACAEIQRTFHSNSSDASHEQPSVLSASQSVTTAFFWPPQASLIVQVWIVLLFWIGLEQTVEKVLAIVAQRSQEAATSDYCSWTIRVTRNRMS